jgi:transcriptional regulator with XRE-family HTH domain
MAMDELARQLGKRLKGLRKDQGKSQETVAWWAGCSIPELSQYENGQRLPNIKRLIGLARALGVTLDALVPVEETIEAAKNLRSPARVGSKPGRIIPPRPLLAFPKQTKTAPSGAMPGTVFSTASSQQTSERETNDPLH